MRDTEPRGRDGTETSPLDLIPGLVDVARVMADAVTVTDLHRRVVVWNEAAAELYGIPADAALGRPVDELYDSSIVGEGVSSSGARALALERGTWRGRVADRPTFGAKVGQELVIDVVLSRLDDAGGRPAGVLSLKRDLTATVNIERELAALSSLTTLPGGTRSREAFAQRALDLLVSSTGADHGAIILADGPAGRLIAGHDVPRALQMITAIPWSELPAVRTVSQVGRVLNGAIERLPLAPQSRRAFLDSNVRTLVLVGLHRDTELVGLLSLVWRRDDPVTPSDAMILLLAGQITRGLENARLVEEVVRRADNERATAARLRALDELTRVGGNVTTIDELAERSGRLINDALGASGTAYGLLAPDGESYGTSTLVDVEPTIAAWLHEHRPDLSSTFRRWRAGEGAFVQTFEPGALPLPLVEMARAAGVTAYAAIPVRVDDVVVGGIAAYFDRPVDDLHIDRVALDRVATIASISLANFRLRERLVGSETRYRTLFEESPDALLVSLVTGPVVDANEAAQRMFRAEREWLVGREPSELAVPDDLWAQIDLRLAGLDVGRSVAGRATGLRRDGDHFPEEAEIARVELDGEPRLLIRLRDLTEQQRLETELIQAQKMEATGQLVSGVAHELNNPLAAILGFSQLIRRDPSLPEELRHNADLLVEEATRTKRIVQNLLDFAKQRPPERYPTQIRALVDSVLALQSYSLGRGRIEVEVDMPDDLPHVELDRGQLQQVLVNLTHNAAYAVREGGGGRIRISAAAEGPPEDRRVRVTVMDDGPGVAPEHVARLFEAFFTTKPPSDGTGLGLPVSYGIIHSHGGELRYAPASWGRGAAFTFDLPVRGVALDAIPSSAVGTGSQRPTRTGPAPADPGAPADPATTADPAGALVPAARPALGRVLVLDDEPSIRVYLERALQALGYEPVIAATGVEAIELAAEGDYAALLCDHRMAGLTGIDVHDAIVATRPDLAARYVLMSGDVLNPEIEAFVARHRVGLLAKPFDLETLDHTIRTAMGAGGGRDT